MRGSPGSGSGGLALRAIVVGALCASLILALNLLGATQLPVIRAPLLALHDLAQRYQAAGSGEEIPDALLVIVDDASIGAEAQRRGRFPATTYSRTIAGVIDRARGAGIPLVVIDVDLGIDRSPQDDAMLIGSLQRWAGSPDAGALLLVLGSNCPVGAAHCPGFSGSLAELVNGAPNIGWVSADLQEDLDGVLRSIDLSRRWSGGRSEPRHHPYVAHLAADLWKAFEGQSGNAAAIARNRLTSYKNCRRTRPFAQCMAAIPTPAGHRVPMSPAFRMPDFDELAEGRPEDASRPGLALQSDLEFVRGRWADDRSRMPLFFGVTHFRSTDRFETSVGLMPGVVVIAGMSASLVEYGVPNPAPLWISALLAGLWGSAIFYLIIWAERRRAKESRRAFGPLRPTLYKLIHPDILVPVSLLLANVLFFILTARWSRYPEDWAAIALTSTILSLLLAFKKVRGILAGRVE